MKKLETEKGRKQQEKIHRFREITKDDAACLNNENNRLIEKIVERFGKQKPPFGRRD